MCIYLNASASVYLTGMEEPNRSLIACQGPLTSLHRIIPAITQGYAICDIIQGYQLFYKGSGPEFIAHGFATLLGTTLFNEYNLSHILTPMLVLEGSTIILAILRADFLSPKSQILCQAMFVILFFWCRLVIFPYIYLSAMSVGPTECIPSCFYQICIILGAFFNFLNIFWFLKILLKVKRKISGTEPVACVERK